MVNGLGTEETFDDETFEVEADGIDMYGPESSRKSLSKDKKGSGAGDIEMQQIKPRGSKSPTLKKKSGPLDIVEICQQAYLDNPRPRKLGKLYCFWYNSKNAPRIVIGPDWHFSLVELLLVNGITSSVLYPAMAQGSNKLFLIGLLILIL